MLVQATGDDLTRYDANGNKLYNFGMPIALKHPDGRWSWYTLKPESIEEAGKFYAAGLLYVLDWRKMNEQFYNQ